jgi:predicted amidophosphoribosyltransferase
MAGERAEDRVSHPARTVPGVLDRLVAFVFPLACPGCGQRAEPVCDTCAATLRPAVPAHPPAGVDDWAAPFAYEGVARELVARVKYRGMHAVVGWLADAMAPLVGLPVASVVTWVPTTPGRRRERGFDHAELLARAVGRRLARPAPRLLERGVGIPQTGLSGAARRRGPRVTARRIPPAHVLLVDDVATTGASLSAAAGALRRAGAVRVVALTAARTPPPSTS